MGGVNNWLGTRSKLEPMPPSPVEEPVVPFSEDEEILYKNRNPYDGTVHMNGKKYFWDDI